MVHVEETTSHRRYAGFFIRNAEHAQRVFNTIHSSPLPSQRRQGAAADKEGKQDEKKTERKPQAWAPKSRQVRVAA